MTLAMRRLCGKASAIATRNESTHLCPGRIDAVAQRTGSPPTVARFHGRMVRSVGRVRTAGGYRGEPRRSPRLSNIEVEREFPRVRTQPHRVDLVLALVVDPRLDHVGREDVALEQPVVALLEVVEHDLERARELLDLLGLGRRQLVEVLVDGLAWVDLVGDAVESRHQTRREA